MASLPDVTMDAPRKFSDVRCLDIAMEQLSFDLKEHNKESKEENTTVLPYIKQTLAPRRATYPTVLGLSTSEIRRVIHENIKRDRASSSLPKFSVRMVEVAEHTKCMKKVDFISPKAERFSSNGENYSNLKLPQINGAGSNNLCAIGVGDEVEDDKCEKGTVKFPYLEEGGKSGKHPMLVAASASDEFLRVLRDFE